MRVALQTAPLLLIGFVLIGCSKHRDGGDTGQPPAKATPEPTADGSTVTLNVPGMF
jgi:hypothetical protein